nr:PrpF domain-containing protein [Paraburkholderia sp. Tr-20389]
MAPGEPTNFVPCSSIYAKIIAYVPIKIREIIEVGDFELDGVTFPVAEIRIEFLDPGDAEESEETARGMFPTGNAVASRHRPDTSR